MVTLAVDVRIEDLIRAESRDVSVAEEGPMNYLKSSLRLGELELKYYLYIDCKIVCSGLIPNPPNIYKVPGSQNIVLVLQNSALVPIER